MFHGQLVVDNKVILTDDKLEILAGGKHLEGIDFELDKTEKAAVFITRYGSSIILKDDKGKILCLTLVTNPRQFIGLVPLKTKVHAPKLWILEDKQKVNALVAFLKGNQIAITLSELEGILEGEGRFDSNKKEQFNTLFRNTLHLIPFNNFGEAFVIPTSYYDNLLKTYAVETGVKQIAYDEGIALINWGESSSGVAKYTDEVLQIDVAHNGQAVLTEAKALVIMMPDTVPPAPEKEPLVEALNKAIKDYSGLRYSGKVEVVDNRLADNMLIRTIDVDVIFDKALESSTLTQKTGRENITQKQEVFVAALNLFLESGLNDSPLVLSYDSVRANKHIKLRLTKNAVELLFRSFYLIDSLDDVLRTFEEATSAALGHVGYNKEADIMLANAKKNQERLFGIRGKVFNILSELVAGRKFTDIINYEMILQTFGTIVIPNAIRKKLRDKVFNLIENEQSSKAFEDYRNKLTQTIADIVYSLTGKKAVIDKNGVKIGNTYVLRNLTIDTDALAKLFADAFIEVLLKKNEKLESHILNYTTINNPKGYFGNLSSKVFEISSFGYFVDNIRVYLNSHFVETLKELGYGSEAFNKLLAILEEKFTRSSIERSRLILERPNIHRFFKFKDYGETFEYSKLLFAFIYKWYLKKEQNIASKRSDVSGGTKAVKVSEIEEEAYTKLSEQQKELVERVIRESEEIDELKYNELAELNEEAFKKLRASYESSIQALSRVNRMYEKDPDLKADFVLSVFSTLAALLQNEHNVVIKRILDNAKEDRERLEKELEEIKSKASKGNTNSYYEFILKYSKYIPESEYVAIVDEILNSLDNPHSKELLEYVITSVFRDISFALAVYDRNFRKIFSGQKEVPLEEIEIFLKDIYYYISEEVKKYLFEMLFIPNRGVELLKEAEKIKSGAFIAGESPIFPLSKDWYLLMVRGVEKTKNPIRTANKAISRILTFRNTQKDFEVKGILRYIPSYILDAAANKKIAEINPADNKVKAYLNSLELPSKSGINTVETILMSSMILPSEVNTSSIDVKEEKLTLGQGILRLSALSAVFNYIVGNLLGRGKQRQYRYIKIVAGSINHKENKLEIDTKKHQNGVLLSTQDPNNTIFKARYDLLTGAAVEESIKETAVDFIKTDSHNPSKAKQLKTNVAGALELFKEISSSEHYLVVVDTSKKNASIAIPISDIVNKVFVWINSFEDNASKDIRLLNLIKPILEGGYEDLRLLFKYTIKLHENYVKSEEKAFQNVAKNNKELHEKFLHFIAGLTISSLSDAIFDYTKSLYRSLAYIELGSVTAGMFIRDIIKRIIEVRKARGRQAKPYEIINFTTHAPTINGFTARAAYGQPFVVKFKNSEYKVPTAEVYYDFIVDKLAWDYLKPMRSPIAGVFSYAPSAITALYLTKALLINGVKSNSSKLAIETVFKNNDITQLPVKANLKSVNNEVNKILGEGYEVKIKDTPVVSTSVYPIMNEEVVETYSEYATKLLAKEEKLGAYLELIDVIPEAEMSHAARANLLSAILLLSAAYDNIDPIKSVHINSTAVREFGGIKFINAVNDIIELYSKAAFGSSPSERVTSVTDDDTVECFRRYVNSFVNEKDTALTKAVKTLVVMPFVHSLIDTLVDVVTTEENYEYIGTLSHRLFSIYTYGLKIYNSIAKLYMENQNNNELINALIPFLKVFEDKSVLSDTIPSLRKNFRELLADIKKFSGYTREIYIMLKRNEKEGVKEFKKHIRGFLAGIFSKENLKDFAVVKAITQAAAYEYTTLYKLIKKYSKSNDTIDKVLFLSFFNKKDGLNSYYDSMFSTSLMQIMDTYLVSMKFALGYYEKYALGQVPETLVRGGRESAQQKLEILHNNITSLVNSINPRNVRNSILSLALGNLLQSVEYAKASKAEMDAYIKTLKPIMFVSEAIIYPIIRRISNVDYEPFKNVMKEVSAKTINYIASLFDDKTKVITKDEFLNTIAKSNIADRINYYKNEITKELIKTSYGIFRLSVIDELLNTYKKQFLSQITSELNNPFNSKITGRVDDFLFELNKLMSTLIDSKLHNDVFFPLMLKFQEDFIAALNEFLAIGFKEDSKLKELLAKINKLLIAAPTADNANQLAQLLEEYVVLVFNMDNRELINRITSLNYGSDSYKQELRKLLSRSVETVMPYYIFALSLMFATPVKLADEIFKKYSLSEAGKFSRFATGLVIGFIPASNIFDIIYKLTFGYGIEVGLSELKEKEAVEIPAVELEVSEDKLIRNLITSENINDISIYTRII